MFAGAETGSTAGGSGWTAGDAWTTAGTTDPASLIRLAALSSFMPPTLEVKCTNEDCEMDMFELHYTYDMPEEVGVEDFVCPYCRETDPLEEIRL